VQQHPQWPAASGRSPGGNQYHLTARNQPRADASWRIPFRSDHCHGLLDDARRKTRSGYPLIRRMRGLAELRGVMTAATAITRLSL
jgi:mannonate dehydratase